MNAVISMVFAWGLVASVCSVPVQRNKRWALRQTFVEPAPGLSGTDLKTVLETAPDIRYSDWDKHLTAQKSSKFKACFIVDLDPDFYLLETEMDKITMEKEPDVIDSPPAYYRFRQRAGDLITSMCHNMDIFWLNEVAPPLPLSKAPPLKLPQPIPIRQETATPHLATNAPPIRYPQPIPVGNDRAPPLLETKTPLLKSPPPVGTNGHHLSSVHVPGTPPPVYIYQQQQQEQKRDRMPPTPPPVELYHRQQMDNQNAV